ncbi:discoidin, CUB and LCCL domain-containing protein 2-like [Branchiostoma floridae x Branchiostoma japonicum]
MFPTISRFLVCLCICCLFPVAESDDTVDCSTDSRGFNGDTFNVTCPAGCASAITSVWGTGVYTNDSSICRAAIHDGRLTDAGGQVTVYRWPGQDSYLGSYKNGVQTSYHGSWDGSFAFTRDTVWCSTDSTVFDDDPFTFTCKSIFQLYSVTCPAGCSPYQWNRRVWGTGVYRSDSSICRAAIHDGRITDDGGQVTVYRWPGQDSYQGSGQNGIQTSYWESWDGSFAFTRDTVWCSTDSTVFDDDPFTVTCPAGCSDRYSAPVWGTGVYGSDSSICRAAIHDGRITDDGGQMTVYRWPGQDSYQGSTQNDIETYGYSYYYSSFAFTRVCRDSLGMEDETIKDGDITASSYRQSRPPWAARLNGDSAWRPSSPFEGSWIQVDLGQRTTVSGVITQGYGWRYITQCQVRYINHDGTWANVTSPTGHSMG